MLEAWGFKKIKLNILCVTYDGNISYSKTKSNSTGFLPARIAGMMVCAKREQA